MVLIRAGALNLFRTFSIFALACGTVACFLLTFAYVGGDATDRAEMHLAISRISKTLRLIPAAQAEPARSISSLKEVD
jgi:hypothetical protein